MSETNTPAAPAEGAAVAEAPVEAPVVVETPVVETPAAPTEPVVEAAPAVTPHTDTATLLEGIGKEEVRPGEEAPKPVEVAPPAPAAPTYESFKFPEGVEAQPEQIQAYTGLIGKYGLPQEDAQALLDMHTAKLQEFASHTLENQHRVFAETRREWANQVRSDEQLGGAGFETSMKAVARMRDLLVPPEHQEAFTNFLRVTGAGDHPEFIRLFHNAARYFDEPSVPSVTAQPPPAPSGRGAARMIYDHPNSQRARG